MQIEELRIGKKIYITLKRIDEAIEQNYELPSQIVDIIDNNNFIILSPFYKGNVIELQAGDELIVNLTHENGIYFFLGLVIDIINEEGRAYYSVKVSSDIKKLQRREHFRLEITVPIVYQYITDNDKDIQGQGVTKDVSGGGLKFVSSSEIKVGQSLDIFVRFSQELEIKTSAKVIRCSRAGHEKYDISILFGQLSFGKRETLIKYIFNLQRDNLKNNR